MLSRNDGGNRINSGGSCGTADHGTSPNVARNNLVKKRMFSNSPAFRMQALALHIDGWSAGTQSQVYASVEVETFPGSVGVRPQEPLSF